jgi:hypothetical protein
MFHSLELPCVASNTLSVQRMCTQASPSRLVGWLDTHTWRGRQHVSNTVPALSSSSLNTRCPNFWGFCRSGSIDKSMGRH